MEGADEVCRLEFEKKVNCPECMVTDLPEPLKQDILLVMNLHQVTLLVLPDWSAAFDTVNYEVLLKRLSCRLMPVYEERLLIGLSVTYEDASERPN